MYNYNQYLKMNDTDNFFFTPDRVANMIIDPNPIFGKLTERDGTAIYNYMTGDQSTTRALAYEEFWTTRDQRGLVPRNIREVATLLRVFDVALEYNTGSGALFPVELFKLIDKLGSASILHLYQNQNKLLYRAVICALNHNVHIEHITMWLLYRGNDFSVALRSHLIGRPFMNNLIIDDMFEWIEE
jgi:hypothetical protein